MWDTNRELIDEPSETETPRWVVIAFRIGALLALVAAIAYAILGPDFSAAISIIG